MTGQNIKARKQPEASSVASDAPNSVGRTVGLIGDEWVLLILKRLMLRASRYIDLKAELSISDAVLSNRLQRLVEAGVIERRALPGAPSSTVYACTKKGSATWPVLLTIWDWERRWVKDHRLNLPRMRHSNCGAFFHPRVVCGHCEQPTGPSDISAQWGPSGGWSRSIPQASTRRRGGLASDVNVQGYCPETMALLGNRWSMALMIGAFLGLRRFSAFQANLGIPPALLAQRLEAFCELGVLVATTSEERADWFDYQLTDKGRAFWPVILCLTQWALRWMTEEGEGEALLMAHASAGHTLSPKLACSHCGGLLSGAEIELVD